MLSSKKCVNMYVSVTLMCNCVHGESGGNGLSLELKREELICNLKSNDRE